jgi:UDP-N-acetylmuramoyl-L-alanyl-D-glutamate--2,6-diaminopimelate ligase
MMAEVSAELADLTVLTAEDPRTESLEDILEEMAAGARSRGGREGETFWRVPDRGEAIRFALRLAREGELLAVEGPEMPYLPTQNTNEEEWLTWK